MICGDNPHGRLLWGIWAGVHVSQILSIETDLGIWKEWGSLCWFLAFYGQGQAWPEWIERMRSSRWNSNWNMLRRHFMRATNSGREPRMPAWRHGLVEGAHWSNRVPVIILLITNDLKNKIKSMKNIRLWRPALINEAPIDVSWHRWEVELRRI